MLAGSGSPRGHKFGATTRLGTAVKHKFVGRKKDYCKYSFSVFNARIRGPSVEL